MPKWGAVAISIRRRDANWGIQHDDPLAYIRKKTAMQKPEKHVIGSPSRMALGLRSVKVSTITAIVI